MRAITLAVAATVSACSADVVGGNAVLSVFRPDVLAAYRCYDAELAYDPSVGCIPMPRRPPSPSLGYTVDTPYMRWLMGGHEGPQRYSGDYLERATGASPSFTHHYGR